MQWSILDGSMGGVLIEKGYYWLWLEIILTYVNCLTSLFSPLSNSNYWKYEGSNETQILNNSTNYSVLGWFAITNGIEKSSNEIDKT